MSRIFFLEATIFRLHVDERIICDAEGDTNFTVKIDLIDIPSLVIRRNESFENMKTCDDDDDDVDCGKNLDYYVGGACHFVGKCREIVDSLKRKPLRIGIYRVDERFPICHGVVPFSGCVCDLVTRAMEKPNPFEFRGIFNLIDPGGNPAGHASLEIILQDLGNHFITLFALDRGSFVLKNDPEGVEYTCGESKIPEDRDKKNSLPPTIDDCCSLDCGRDNFMLDIAGISLAARRLSLGKPEVKIKVRRSLNDGQEQSDESKVKPDNVDAKKSVKKSKNQKK